MADAATITAIAGDAGSAISSIGGGIADLFASGDYAKEASIYGEDVTLSKESTALKEYVANKQIMAGYGGQVGGYAGGNLQTAGTALDALRETAQLGAIHKGQISVQGQIEANNFAEEQAAANSQATTSLISGITGIASGGANLGILAAMI